MSMTLGLFGNTEISYLVQGLVLHTTNLYPNFWMLCSSQKKLQSVNAKHTLTNPILFFLGNAAAKERKESPAELHCVQISTKKNTPILQVSELQQDATPEEKALWRKAGCSVQQEIQTCPKGWPCLPKYMFSFYARLMDCKTHALKGGMIEEVNKRWLQK